jgi:ribonuclease HIII
VEFSDVDFIQMTKAERHLGVAAASILARFEMNKWFEQKQNEGFNVKKGASGEVELAAKSILKRNGHKILNSLVKLHFKTTQKIFED